MSHSFATPWTEPAKLLCPWDFPSKNSGVGCHFLLQEIFSTQGSSPHLLQLLHWQVDSLPLSHLGSPRIWEWVAYPFSRGSSQSRNQTGVSCIAGGFFTSWATREAHYLLEFAQILVHWVGNDIQPSHPFLPPSLFALNLSKHQGLFQWISSSYQVVKVLELQLQY